MAMSARDATMLMWQSAGKPLWRLAVNSSILPGREVARPSRIFPYRACLRTFEPMAAISRKPRRQLTPHSPHSELDLRPDA